jgi:hypothetical protein
MTTKIPEASIELLRLERYAIRMQLEENSKAQDKAYRIENFESYQKVYNELRSEAQLLRVRVNTLSLMIELYENDRG